MNIACIIGSLRELSLNRALFNTVQELAPEGVTIEEASIHDVPLYNADNENPLPEPVAVFKKAIESADGVIIITPEYNRSIPGVLKNAIDWASRPAKQSSWHKKPVAVMGATPGSFGTLAAQLHLRGILVHLGTDQMGQPAFLLSNANEKIDSEGHTLSDTETREKISSFLAAFAEHIQR